MAKKPLMIWRKGIQLFTERVKEIDPGLGFMDFKKKDGHMWLIWWIKTG
jgi:hypothetical protein